MGKREEGENEQFAHSDRQLTRHSGAGIKAGLVDVQLVVEFAVGGRHILLGDQLRRLGEEAIGIVLAILCDDKPRSQVRSSSSMSSSASSASWRGLRRTETNGYRCLLGSKIFCGPCSIGPPLLVGGRHGHAVGFVLA